MTDEELIALARSAALKPVDAAKPKPPALLADEHGTLRIDLGSGVQLAER